MREIKFRAWRKKSKLMSPALTLLEWIDLGTHHGELVSSHEVEWMQYTGLKDKNSVEIYEGDIVDCWDSVDALSHKVSGTGIIGTVDFNGGCFCVKNCDGYHNRLALTCAENVKVIGNIHENPELIK